MDAFPGIISVVVFVAVVVSSSISLRLLGKEPVASNTNISTWILNCALANYLHCLFILPIGIGFHSLGLQDLHIVEDIWMELETPFSLQFHSVAFLFVIFSEYMKIRQLSKIKAHALVFLSVFVTSLCFMFPQIIIRATNTEDLTNATDSFDSFGLAKSDSLNNYLLLCIAITGVILPGFLIVVCHPFTKHIFLSIQQNQEKTNMQISENGPKAGLTEATDARGELSRIRDQDSNDIELEYITENENTEIKQHGNDKEERDKHLETKLIQFREMQKRLRHCGMMTSSCDDLEDGSEEDSCSYDTPETEADCSMIRKFYVNVFVHFLFWLPWLGAEFANWSCHFCNVSKPAMFLVSLIPCVGMIFTPALITIKKFAGNCS